MNEYCVHIMTNSTRRLYTGVTNISREKQIKGWLRSKKVALVESMNPEWKDLSTEWS